MARIIYGPIITDIAGSIGGVTFQKNGAGTIARLKPRKTQTNTQRQRDQQPRLKQLQREWNLLSLANKILWNDFAAINKKIGLDGQEKTLTGYQWFLTINENRLLFDDSILSVPPVYEVVNPIDNIIIGIAPDSLFVNTNPVDNSNLYNWLIYASFIINSASKFDFNKNRLLRKIVGSFDGARSIAIQPNFQFWENYYNSVFPPNLGNKNFYFMVYLKAISKASGIASLAYTSIVKFIWDGTKYVIE